MATIAIKSMTVATLGTVELIYKELVVQAQDWSNKNFDQWQRWSNETFDNEYREAILTLVAGVALLVGYTAGYAYGWLKLQVIIAVGYWLADAVQAVPVHAGWWQTPFIVLKPVVSLESYWQVVEQDILNYELSWARPADLR